MVLILTLYRKFSSGLPLGSVMKNMISSNGGIVSALSRYSFIHLEKNVISANIITST